LKQSSNGLQKITKTKGELSNENKADRNEFESAQGDHQPQPVRVEGAQGVWQQPQPVHAEDQINPGTQTAKHPSEVGDSLGCFYFHIPPVASIANQV